MARHRDDDTIRPDETSPEGAAIDDDPILDRPDPLGLGGTPPPDAPSRSPRPRIVGLLGEFFRMSRTTAILLGVFVLAGALYLLVRDEPVVAFGPQPEGDTTETSEPAEPSSTPTDQATDTTVPTSSPTPTGTGSRTTGTTAPGGTATTGPGTDGPGGGAGQQTPQQQQQTQQQQNQQPQQQPDQQSQPQLRQEAPGGEPTSVPGGGALEG